MSPRFNSWAASCTLRPLLSLSKGLSKDPPEAGATWPARKRTDTLLRHLEPSKGVPVPPTSVEGASPVPR